MATFDTVINTNVNVENFIGYTGNPPTTEAEYNNLGLWVDYSIAPTWTSISSDIALEEVLEARKQAYPSLADQADMAYWDRQNGTTTLDDAITAVKEAHPKPA
jgi:hypothetical protein